METGCSTNESNVAVTREYFQLSMCTECACAESMFIMCMSPVICVSASTCQLSSCVIATVRVHTLLTVCSTVYLH